VRFVSVEFEQLSFTSINGSKPHVNVHIGEVRFGEALAFVKRFAELFDSENGFFMDLQGVALRVGYRFGLPALTMGGFNLVDLAIGVGVRIRFDGGPVRLDCNVSTRQRPFLMSVGILVGGGFFGISLSPRGVELIEGSMEFGAGVMLNIANIAVGRAKIVAGIYFSISRDEATVCGYVCASGVLRIIGLISVSMELYIGLSYVKRGGVSLVAGEVRVSVEIDFCFFSVTVRFRYYKEFAGSGGGATPNYASAFGQGRLVSWVAPESAARQSFARYRKNWRQRRRRLVKC
jgi:hypothetical protein